MSAAPSKLSKATIVMAIVAIVVLVLVVGAGVSVLVLGDRATAAPGNEGTPDSQNRDLAAPHPSRIYGRITTPNGTELEGPLRFAGSEEALWSHYFHGYKKDNPWVRHLSDEQQPTEERELDLFGFKVASGERKLDLGRPFVARMGDITRIEADGRDLRVTLKSGTTFQLDRMNADDFGDGLQIWDQERGLVELNERQIRTIDLISMPESSQDPGDAPRPLFGTVRTRKGEFTGLIQWNRTASLGSDRLVGRTSNPDGKDTTVSLRFETVRSIENPSRRALVVTLRDGKEIQLDNPADTHRGIQVDDRRYGRVLVPWQLFERLELEPGGDGPSYDDFPAGRALTGRVTTRNRESLAGRLVFDLDESETTETLDAPSQGIDYTLPFGLIASIALPSAPGGGSAEATATVTLHGGEILELERSGDLDRRNGGMLVFENETSAPDYVPWKQVERIDFDRPASMYP